MTVRIVLILGLMLLTNYVINAQSTFSGSRLKEAALSHIQDRCLTDCEIVVNTIQTQKFDESAVEANIVDDIAYFKGRMNVTVEFKKNSLLLRSLQVPVYVKLFSILPTAASNLMSGHTLQESDILEKKVDITAYKESEIVTKPEVIGFRTIQRIQQGALITANSVLSPESIRKGDIITLIVQYGTVTVRGTAVALENGEIGDKIRISREGSQSVLIGIVQQNGIVFVTK